MSKETVIANSHQPGMADTRRSWSAARRFVVMSCTALAAALGFIFGFSVSNEKDSDSTIAEFEMSLREYLRSATASRCARLSLVPRDTFSVEIPDAYGLNADRLQNAANRLVFSNRERARARINQAIAEYNYARSANSADLSVHTDASQRALHEPWQRRSDYDWIPVGCKCAAVAAIATWIASSILVFVCAFLWWFLMDRLRDVSRALKG